MNKRRNLIFTLVRAVLAIGIALLVAMALIFLCSDKNGFVARLVDTFKTMRYMLISPLFRSNGSFSVKGLTDVLALTVPIMFTGLATTVMFSAKQFNLGAEGGIMLSAFTAGVIAVYAPLPAIVLPVVAVIGACVVTAAMMLIPAVLKAKYNVSEMVNSLMLNYVIMYVIKYLMNTYLCDTTRGSVQTLPYQPQATFAPLINNGSKLSYGFIIGLFMSVLIWLFMYRTKWGYGVRMIGINQKFSQYSGINVAKAVIICQVIGGVLAGMGGAVEQLGRYQAYDWMALTGHGWTGITVAILANNNPIFVPLAAFFMSYLDKGCQLMTTHSPVPAQLINIIQAVIFLFFAARKFLARYRQRLVVKTAREDQAAMERAAAGLAGLGSKQAADGRSDVEVK